MQGPVLGLYILSCVCEIQQNVKNNSVDIQASVQLLAGDTIPLKMKF